MSRLRRKLAAQQRSRSSVVMHTTAAFSAARICGIGFAERRMDIEHKPAMNVKIQTCFCLSSLFLSSNKIGYANLGLV
jgi:hypothetical protein